MGVVVASVASSLHGEKTTVVLQSNYLPWRGYFDLIQSADHFVFYDDVKYTKNDWRNRNRLRTKNGVHWLTIPVAKTAVNQLIKDVELGDPRWQEKHYRAIYYAYKRAPYFHQIEPLLDAFYRQRVWRYLSELNRFCIETISRMLGITTQFLDSRSLPQEGDRVTRLVAILRHLGTTEYVSGPRGRNYLAGQEQLFADNGIRITYKSYEGYPEYPQLATPFVSNVSIVDMLANAPLAELPHLVWGWRADSRPSGEH